MSEETGEDLINFETSSADLPLNNLAATNLLDSEPVASAGNLLDSALVLLEQTLQTANMNKCRSHENSNKSIDLEEILITIDDVDGPDGIERRACSSRKNSLDVCSALEELDRIINESTNSNTSSYFDEDSDSLSLNTNECNVEDCLRDLDDYLQGFDTSGASDNTEMDSNLDKNDSLRVSSPQGELGDRAANLTNKLLRLASHTKSLRQGNCNKAFQPERRRPLSAEFTFRGKFKSDENDCKNNNGTNIPYTSLDRPSSADKLQRNSLLRSTIASCSSSAPNLQKTVARNLVKLRELRELKEKRTLDNDEGKVILERNNKWRYTIGVVEKLERNKIKRRKTEDNNKSTTCVCSNNNNNIESIAIENISDDSTKIDTSTSGEDTDSIDWSWIHEMQSETSDSVIVNSDVMQSDLVQIPIIQLNEESIPVSSSPPPLPPPEAVVETPSSSTDPQGSVRGSWLRNSMRRVRHFRLPSEVEGSMSISTPHIVATELGAAPTLPAQQRPLSAPEVVHAGGVPGASVTSTRARPQSRSRSLSSSDSSLASSVDTSPSCTPVATPTRPSNPQVEAAAPPPTGGTNRRACDSAPTTGMPEARSALGQWPHGLSSMLACLGCTLGLFNVSRFAILSVRFGANFIVQFLLLSLIFGIPLFTLQLCLGQQLAAGVIDMWRISPLFQGVGVALLVAQALIGLYSIVGISWMFIYFRDSFITKQDQYKWAEQYDYYREDSKSALNGTYKISETVPDYFSGIVLQRHNLVGGNSFGAIKFQVAFNLAVVWMIVFVSLSKGLRSYAKVVYVFTLLPIFGTFVLCAKLLGMTPNDSLHEVFPETSWTEFFLNSKSWLAASQEAFLTWGLLGASVMQLSSHNKHKHLLQRDSSLVIILTITILMLTAFLANTCVEILHFYGYSYMPNSFERISTYVFLRPTKEPLPPSLASTPVRYMTHSSFIIGERVVRPGMDKTMESGYQVLRFATELVPATLALLGPTQISPFWAVLFYFILILFGIAQQLAIWHCVITGIMAIRAKVLKSWETTITFFTCTFGFILGLPMTTEFGIFVVFFLDYCVGGAWWLIFVYLIEIVAVFMVRGRPYSGDTVVTALFTSTTGSCVQTWLAPLLSFTWNVVLPTAMMVICITWFKSGNFKELFVWHHAPSLEYWPTWSRQIGSLIQILPILFIPIVAIIQSYRYLNNGPPDILDRIQLLYRPPLDSEHLDDLTIHQAATANNNNSSTNPAAANIPGEDPPPKYTPPPSYTTATGARIAKLLRQSIRRSVRRLANVLGEGSGPRNQERPNLQNIQNLQVPPPDYSAVLVEMNQSQATDVTAITILDSTVTDGNISSSNPSTTDRINRELRTLQPGSPLTAADVATILRSSFRRSTVRNGNRMRRSAPEEIPGGSLSAECLVDGIAPIGQTSLVLDLAENNGNSETKGADNRFSVI